MYTHIPQTIHSRAHVRTCSRPAHAHTHMCTRTHALMHTLALRTHVRTHAHTRAHTRAHTHRAWPSSVVESRDECGVHLFASAERIGIPSPLNTGIFLAHRICSKECLQAAIDIHEHATKGDVEWDYNDQNAIVHLWQDGSGTCKIKKMPAAMQVREGKVAGWSR